MVYFGLKVLSRCEYGYLDPLGELGVFSHTSSGTDLQWLR